MKNIWIIFLLFLAGCSSENADITQYETNGDFHTTTASIEIYSVDNFTSEPATIQGVTTLIDYAIISDGKYGAEPEESIKNSFLRVESIEVCFNLYCMTDNMTDINILPYNSGLKKYLSIDYKKLSDLPDGIYTLRMAIQASEEFDNTTTTKMFYTTFGNIKLIKPYYPASHKVAGFTEYGSYNFHCYKSCQIPTNNWLNTPSQDCIACHTNRPVTSVGALHPIR